MLRHGHRERNLLFAGILGLAAILALGTILAPRSVAADYRFKVLRFFCPSGVKCTDGQYLNGGLIMDAAGNLYGTTGFGGDRARCRGLGCGMVFELTPDPTRPTGWAQTVLYRFCPGGLPCADGGSPNGLIMDGAGNLYGSAADGGTLSRLCPSLDGCGTIFSVTPNASRPSRWEREPGAG
jgi:hypothetical protein